MANIAVSAQFVSGSGLAVAYQAPITTDTYQISNDNKVFLHVKKTGAGNCNMTIITPGTDADGNAISDKVVVIPATTGDRMCGPYNRSVYGDTLSVTFSDVAGLTFAAITLP